METNPPPDPLCILDVNIDCCKKCPDQLKKCLLKIDGVVSVDVDPGKRLVSVIGKIDPVILIKRIKKMGKKVELLFYKKIPINYEEKKNDHKMDTEKADSGNHHDSDHYAKRNIHKKETENVDSVNLHDSDHYAKRSIHKKETENLDSVNLHDSDHYAKRNIHKKETENADSGNHHDSHHYAKRKIFQGHQRVQFATPRTEFLDHICGDVRSGIHNRHLMLPGDFSSSFPGFLNSDLHFDPDYYPPHYPEWYG